MPGCIPRPGRPSSFWMHPPKDREPRHIDIRSAGSERWVATPTACREVVVGTSCRSRRLGTGRLCIQVNVTEAGQEDSSDFPTYPNRSRDWLRSTKGTFGVSAITKCQPQRGSHGCYLSQRLSPSSHCQQILQDFQVHRL